MNIQLKQRLMGAVVLVSLAVIFIPMILPGGGELSNSIEGSNVPAPPDYRFPAAKSTPKAPAMAAAPPVPLKGDSTLVRTTSEKAGDIPLPDVSEKAPPKPAKSVKPASSTASSGKDVVAWVVQVGSFSKQRNAQLLRDKLRKQGYASFMERVDGKQRTTYRVRVGPELTRALAVKLQKRLAKKQKLKDTVVKRYP